MFSRSSLKAQEKKVKEAEAFVEQAGDLKEKRSVGRPRTKGEKREPTTISLTKTEAKQFDDIYKRLNVILYSKGDELSLDRSSLVRTLAEQCSRMTNEELWKWFKCK